MRPRSNSARAPKTWKTAATGSAGVDGLDEAADGDLPLVELPDGVDQMP